MTGDIGRIGPPSKRQDAAPLFTARGGASGTDGHKVGRLERVKGIEPSS
jgi:hypothetical protein